MNQTLIYFLTFVHPKTGKVLFSPKGKAAVQFRTQNLPRIGDTILLEFHLAVRGKKRRGHEQTYRFRFKVVEVERMLLAFTPRYESGNPTYFEESTTFWIKVVPTTNEFAGTIRILQKFSEKMRLEWQKWFDSRRQS